MKTYPFRYFPSATIGEWRWNRTEQRLAAFVDEVIHRTLLMPHYRNNDHYRKHPTVSLVGHSMGGLVIAGYIASCSGLRVDKVITLGTPYQGSYEAVAKVVTGTGGILGFGNARERKTARLTPSLYYLVPRCGGLVVDQGVAGDLFDACAWQSSVVDSIVKRANKWGVCGRDLFRAMLAQGKRHRDRVSSLTLSEPDQPDSPADQVSKRNWLSVVGVDSETRVGLRIVSEDNGRRRFVLSQDDRRNEWRSGNVAARRDTGDGVVPVAGAIPSFLEESRVVCVTPGDFHWGEVDDHALRFGTHFHASLPSMNMLQRLIVRFLSGKRDRYGNTWGRRLPGVVHWDPPLNLDEKDKPDLHAEGK